MDERSIIRTREKAVHCISHLVCWLCSLSEANGDFLWKRKEDLHTSERRAIACVALQPEVHTKWFGHASKLFCMHFWLQCNAGNCDTLACAHIVNLPLGADCTWTVPCWRKQTIAMTTASLWLDSEDIAYIQWSCIVWCFSLAVLN